MGFHDFTATLNDGTEQPLSAYRGRAVLVVNVASKCGFTPQYKGLQALYERLHPRGLDILAFPCDQFGHQEPGTDAEIATFCEKNFGVTFPLFQKIEVNGKGAHPLYQWLKAEKGGVLGSAIKWNFSKFLVDPQGRVVDRFAPTTKPEALAEKIEAILPA
ncbi:glutathione peroxidase [Roseococcus suduntuyensis]|uniref:Glutathione peroxidase n=1 Tax=Roseococcus suduntuyensis TaxID=455361 RepID=A0A840A996_9PROT|nr:glutathione peroxidase [Roseococcus suduntuyensis]MBB3897442.1 glutathione peroxidase [Roseococcus suduntuyensis]